MARGDRLFNVLKGHLFDLLDYINDPEGDNYTFALVTACCALLEKALEHIHPKTY